MSDFVVRNTALRGAIRWGIVLWVGPCLDVYVLSGQRDLPTIARFVSEFTSSDLGARLDNFDLTMLPEDYEGDEDSLLPQAWDVVPVETLGHAIRYGLEDANRVFRLYLDRTEPWCGALIAFTRSNEIVFGVSVDDPLGESSAMQEARALMSRLADLTGGRRSWIVVEEPPPLDPERDEPWLRSLA